MWPVHIHSRGSPGPYPKRHSALLAGFPLLRRGHVGAASAAITWSHPARCLRSRGSNSGLCGSHPTARAPEKLPCQGLGLDLALLDSRGALWVGRRGQYCWPIVEMGQLNPLYWGDRVWGPHPPSAPGGPSTPAFCSLHSEHHCLWPRL